MWRYDKKAVGERIKKQRKALDLTQDEVAEKIGKSTKFCADVERGTTGMSINTMLGFCSALKLSPDMLFQNKPANAEDTRTIEGILARCTPKQRVRAREILRLFFED
jgi:transcriptional regulator with XRE-family HTH domain